MPSFSIGDSLPEVNAPIEEIWRDVPGFTHYQVSNQGRVRSRKPPARSKKPRKEWKILKPYRMKNGYLVIKLADCGKGIAYLVHRLVLEAFVGPCPDGMEARHVKDNDRSNNRLDNLCWGTRQENADDVLRHGRRVCGERCHASKLRRSDIKEIFKLWNEGLTRAKIAKRFGVRVEAVWRVLTKQVWAHASVGESAEMRGSLRGSQSPNATFTEEQVREMRRLYSQGVSTTEIARRLNRNRETIWRICTGKSWCHVDLSVTPPTETKGENNLGK